MPTLKQNKTERAQTNDFLVQLKNLEKQEQTKYKLSQQQEIIQIRAEIKEIEAKDNTKIHWVLDKISKTDRPLAQLTKRKKWRTQINQSEMSREVLWHTAKKFRILSGNIFKLCAALCWKALKRRIS